MSREPKAPSRRAAKLGLLVTSTTLALLVSEFVVRQLRLAPELKAIDVSTADCVYQRSTNPILGFELKANFRNANPDFIATYERTNAHGQRDIERSLERKEGGQRILLLGDSVVEGHGLPEHETISRQWEALIPGGSTEVLNFGVSAYCTLAEIELLETKGLAFRPDIVVVLFVENDFDNFNREAFALGQASTQAAPATWLFQHSHLFRQTALSLNLFGFRAAADPVRWNQDAIGDNNVLDGFRRLRALADREGFQPLVAIWPRFLDEEIVNVPCLSTDHATPVVEQIAAAHGLPSARLSVAFQQHRQTTGVKNPRLYYSSGNRLHPSKEGAAVAASALNDSVEKLSSGKLVVDEAKELAPELIAEAKALGNTTPNYARVYHQNGVQHLVEKRYQDAIAAFQQALDEDPQHAGAHGNMGLAYARLGNATQAKACYQKAIEVQRDFVQAHFNLASLLLTEGDSATALPLLERTLKIAPDHTDALNLLGMELGKAGKLGAAKRHLERVIALEPSFSEAHNNLATVYAASGQLSEARRQFKEALRADPNNQGAAARLKQIEAMIQQERE